MARNIKSRLNPCRFNSTNSTKMDKKKIDFIKSYGDAFGNITMAAKIAGIDRKTYYNWIEADPEFKAAIEAVEPNEVFVDFAENALIKRIQGGDTTAIIFALKTKGKKRGYVERQEVTGADGEALNLNVNFTSSGLKPITNENDIDATI